MKHQIHVINEEKIGWDNKEWSHRSPSAIKALAGSTVWATHKALSVPQKAGFVVCLFLTYIRLAYGFVWWLWRSKFDLDSRGSRSVLSVDHWWPLSHCSWHQYLFCNNKVFREKFIPRKTIQTLRKHQREQDKQNSIYSKLTKETDKPEKCNLRTKNTTHFSL